MILISASNSCLKIASSRTNQLLADIHKIGMDLLSSLRILMKQQLQKKWRKWWKIHTEFLDNIVSAIIKLLASIIIAKSNL